MGWFARDIGSAARLLLRNPGFTIPAILTLTIGIGANTAIFSVVNAVLLQPLPYPEPGRIVLIARSYGSIAPEPMSSDRKFLGLRERMRSLRDMSAYDFGGPGLNLAGEGFPERLTSMRVSRDYFRLFGASPILGRTFTAEEDTPGGPSAVVLSHGLWIRRFGGDRDVLGRVIRLSGRSYTVVGVLNPGFFWEPQPDLWIPLQVNANDDAHVNHLVVAARLAPGVTFETANAEMRRAGAELQKLIPDDIDPRERHSLLNYQGYIVGSVRPALWILLGAVGMVLLVACANVANLTLARATRRQKELAVRAAIGAGRLDLIRQMVLESILLALAGGALGVVAAHFGVRALLALNPYAAPRLSSLSSGLVLNPLVLLLTFIAALATGLLFGMVPALQVSRVDLHRTLKEVSGRSGSSLRQNRARGALVVVEMALAVVLLSGAALLIRSFISMRRVDPGVDLNDVLTLDTSLAGSRYRSAQQLAGLESRIRDGLLAVPGVQAVSLSMATPIDSLAIDMPFLIVGRAPVEDQYSGDSQFRFASAGYFEVFRPRLLRGRVFANSDLPNSEPVAVINEAFAKEFFPNQDPVGAQIKIAGGTIFENPVRRIVGVVGNVSERGIRKGKMSILYIPTSQSPDRLIQFVDDVMPFRWAVRSPADVNALTMSVRKVFASVDPELAVANVRSMQTVFRETMSRDDFNAVALAVFGLIALVLAALGIYGVMSYSVAQRTQEIGIRAALGATRSSTWTLIASQGMVLALIGLAIGTVISLGTSRLLESLLYGVKPNDPVTFTAMAIVLALTALAACSIPAWRATRIDPMEALRSE